MNRERIQKILRETAGVKLVVASKYVDSSAIAELCDLDIHDFGENRVDAFLTKADELKDYPICWHFIGHLQTNKAKQVINRIDYLHSLDSLKLAEIIEKRAEKPLKCFVEVHLTDSETKNGVQPEMLGTFLDQLKGYTKVEVVGLMTMTEPEMSEAEKQAVFTRCRQLADQYGLAECSMGMSDDYPIAIRSGATFIRLGRIICQ